MQAGGAEVEGAAAQAQRVAAAQAGPSNGHSASASSAASSRSLPGIVLHLSPANTPQELHAGLTEVARNAPRRNIRVDAEGEALHALHLGGEEKEWHWNVRFEHDASLPARSLHVSASAASFLPPSAPQSGAVETPFVITVRYVRRCEAFRALGHILGVTRDILEPASATTQRHAALYDASSRWVLNPEAASTRLALSEHALFETVGTMIDCSRNGVLRVSSIQYTLRKLALFGYNMLQLYTEDTYKIEDEPFFGYLRGGYTQEELKAVDDYADALGIEVIPCIQTLGHLGQILQWPRFLPLRDTTEVLLAEWEETYALIEKMIATATKPFRTNRVHLGMDETHGLAHGRYHTIFGQHHYKEPTQVFVEHLKRVNSIAKRLGKQPQIWSDMLFCLSARNNSLLGYYDSAQPDASLDLPSDVDLVFWSYYHKSTQFYTDRINSHRLLARKSPWMAAGIWTWTRHWAALPFTFATCRANLNASKAARSGVKHVMATVWGDEGNEHDPLSSLPAWHYYAEHCYEPNEEVNLPRLHARFDGIAGGSFADFVAASKLDEVGPDDQTVDDRIHFAANTSKWLLWEEPALGFVSPSVQASGLDLEAHYGALEAHLTARLSPHDAQLGDGESPQSRDLPLNARLRLPQLLASVLALKAGLRLRLHEAYVKRDWQELERLAGPQPESRLAKLRAALAQLHAYHATMWHSSYKPFGWEVLDLRYGGLRARCETMHARCVHFLAHVRAGGVVGGDPVASASASKAKAGEGELEQGLFLSAQGGATGEYDAQVTQLPELEVKLQVVYASHLQLLDYHRVSRPQYC